MKHTIKKLYIERRNGKKMGIRRVLISTMIVALSVAAGFEVAAQTCKISCGVMADGTRTYKEVFEYDYVSVKPEYPGGESALLAFINKNRNYPSKAYKKGIEGRVICSFVVNVDGKISNIEIFKGVEASLNTEAKRIVGKMPAWSPGSIDGRQVPVRVLCTIPFRK